MEMKGSRVVPTDVDTTWRALNDPEVLRACIPGCESIDCVSDTEHRLAMTARVGPVSAKFTGRLMLADIVAPRSYTLKFEGQGGAAGFANGEAKVSLAASDGGNTALSYAAKANVGGKLAQIGSRLIDGAAAKMADDFFARFAERLAPPPEIAAAPPAPVIGTEPARSHLVRYIALAVMAIILIVLAARGFR